MSTGARASGPVDSDGPVLPDTTSDEHGVGWGDDPSGRTDSDSDPDDLERFLRDVPPHHGD